MITVACAQILIEKNYKINLQTILKHISDCSQNKIDIVCFPETSLVKSTNKNELKSIDFSFLINCIRTACSENKIHCVFSTNILDKEKIYNRAFLIDDTGKILHTYDKIYLFKSEKNVSKGSKNKVVKTKLGKIGIVICWDSTYPEYIASLVQKGAQIIFCPSYIKLYGWGLEPYLAIPMVRAFENKCYFINCDSANKECANYSVICGPTGVSSRMQKKKGIITAKIDVKSRP